MNFVDRRGAAFARNLGHPINTSAASIMGIYTVLWGLWLLAPDWRVFDRAPLYSWLNETAPEYFWGLLAVLCGLFMLYGIVKHSYRSLTSGAFTGFVHWGLIAYGYFVGDWQNTGGITAAMVAAYCAFVYLNLRINRENLPFNKGGDTI